MLGGRLRSVWRDGGGVREERGSEGDAGQIAGSLSGRTGVREAMGWRYERGESAVARREVL